MAEGPGSCDDRFTECGRRSMPVWTPDELNASIAVDLEGETVVGLWGLVPGSRPDDAVDRGHDRQRLVGDEELGVLVGGLGGDGTAPGALVLGFTGMLTALVLLALGVLATAGEWTHRSVQTTYLLVPQRGRVVVAKVAAMTMLGAGLAWIRRRPSSRWRSTVRRQRRSW